jgi:hypothetical protein
LYVEIDVGDGAKIARQLASQLNIEFGSDHHVTRCRAGRHDEIAFLKLPAVSVVLAECGIVRDREKASRRLG